jgi:transposase
MSRKKEPLHLPEGEEASLRAMLSKGVESVRSLKRARILLGLHQGGKAEAVSHQAQVSEATVYNVWHRYEQEGVVSALEEKPRPGQPPKFNEQAQAHLIALACSPAPEGRSRWTFRLLADRVVEIGLVERISHKTIGEELKKKHLSLG